ncbi:MAG: RNA polymerase sigma factor [Nannocystales bacterium]
MGRDDEFRDLVRAHQHDVHAVLARVLFRAALGDVDDLAQETFLRVHRSLSDLEDRGPAARRKWILTIAARIAIDHLRRRSFADAPFEEDVHRLPVPETDELARFRRLEARVEVALAGLTPEHRAVLVLRDLYGFEYAEVATSLELDLGTVKSRLHRARTRVRRALGKDGSG